MTNRNIKNAGLGLLITAALVAAPIIPAQARGWHHGWGWGHHDGVALGIVGAAGAVVGAAVTLATAPFVIAADAVAPGPVYADPAYPAPAPAYYPAPSYGYPAPAPAYYAAPGYGYPAYGYYRPHRVVYAYPAPAPVYGYPAPVYGAYPGY